MVNSSHKSSFARVSSLPWFRVVNPLLEVTAVWCLFSFKVFLVGFGEAGLRPDDLLILCSVVGLLLTRRVQRTPLSLPFKIYSAYLAIEFVSALWNSLQGRVDLIYSLVFVLRPLEYVAFYFIGYSLARSGFQYARVAWWYFVTLCLLVPLQMLSIVPTPNVFGAGRASGNTNGPYELAVVCGFLFCYVAYRQRRALVGLIIFAMTFLTASRITFVALIVSLVHFGFTRTRSRGKLLAVAAVVVVLAGSLYLASSSGLVSIGAFERLGNSKSLTLDDARALYDAAPAAKNAQEYYEGSFQDLNGIDTGSFEGDLSGLIRFTRWINLLKANLAAPDSILIGLGPSFGSAAVDGYYTRCYVETGALGLLAFLAFLASLLFPGRGSNWYFRDYVLIMLISAAFIDVFISYKPMMLLWLWHGMNQVKSPTPSRPRRLALPALPLSLHNAA